jgi:outer membrane protein assembly factor BamA/autotransporter translocation and assembly factor TamB
MAKPTGDRRRYPRWTRLLAGICAALVAVVVAALAVVHTPPVRRYVLDRVTALLAARNIDVDTDELRYNLFNLSLSLRNVRVRSSDLPDAPAFASIDRARLELSLMQLLRGRYVIQSGTLDGVSIHYLVDESGRDNLPRPVRASDRPNEPVDYLIDELITNGVSVRYENRLQKMDAQIPVTQLVVDGNPLTDRHDIRIASRGATLARDGRETPIETLAAALDLGDDDVTVSALEVDVAGAHVRISGAIETFDAPQMNLAVHATVDAARAAPLAQITEPVSGTAVVEATIKGALSQPAIDARVTARDLAFRQLQHVTLQAQGGYDIAARVARVAALKLEAAWGVVTGEGTIALDDSNTSRVRVSADGLDAATLMRAFGTPYVAATRVDARLNASWPGLDYLAASGEGDARLTRTGAVARGTIPLDGRLHASGDRGVIVARLQNVSAAGVGVTGRVTLRERERLDGLLSARITDLATATTAVEIVLGRGRGSVVPVMVRGATTIDARIGGTVAAPTVAAKVAAPALAAGQADGIALSAAVDYSASGVAIHPLDVTWREARIRGEGRVGLTGAKPLDLSLTAEAVDLAQILRALERANIPVSGRLAASGRVTGPLARPRGMFALTGADLVAYGELLGALSADVTLANRIVSMPRLAIDKPQPDRPARITATGRYELDRRGYVFDVQSRDLRLLTATLPDGQAVRGAVELSAKGAGTLDDPAGSVSLRTTDLRVAAYEIGRATGTAVVAKRQAQITATADRYALSADATIGVERPFAATMRARVTNLDLAALPLKLATPLTGRVRATAEASGPLADLPSVRGTATIAAFEGSWNREPFTVEGPANLAYASERLTIDRLRVVARDSSIEIGGELPLTPQAGQGAITVNARADLGTLARYAPVGAEVSGEGAVSVTGVIRGTLRTIDPDLVVTIDRGLLLSPRLEPGLSNVQLRARIAAGAADIETLTANWGSASMAASGRIPLDVLPALPVEIPRQGGPATFKGTLAQLDPATLPGAPPGLSGRVSVQAELSATRADLTALDGRVTFSELRLAFNTVALDQEEPSVLRIAGGELAVERLRMAGSAGTLSAAGTVGLTGARPIDVTANGRLNLAAAAAFTDRIRTEGTTAIDLAARGTVAEPELHGSMVLADGSLALDEPEIAAENVAARVELSGKTLRLTSLTGDVNGGTLQGSGHLTLGTGGIADVDLQLATRDFAFDAPLDLRSISDSTLRIVDRDGDIVVQGKISIQEAGLTGDINFDTGLLAAMNARPTLDLTEARDPWLERVRFDVQVETQSPILVDNNLARAEATADLRVLGTPYETGLSGRLILLEEGEITLNERRYLVERGMISFVDDRRIAPSFDLALTTSARNYDITITVSGTPGDTETTLTSDPALPEPDIMAMLVTGRTLDEMRGEEFDVAREQVLSYLAGRLGSSLGRGLERATGLSTVRIEPNLIANEADPSARLTVGQDLTDDLNLVYSTDLTDSSDQIWVAEYDVTRRFQTRAVRQSDNSYRLEFRHDLRFGGMREPRRQTRVRPIIASIDINGEAPIPQHEFRKLLGVKEADAYDYFALRHGVQRIEERFRELGWLQSRVRVHRVAQGSSVSLQVAITPGDRVDLQFAGTTPPRSVREDVRLKWHRGVFDAQRLDDGVETLKAWLVHERYLQSRVNHSIDERAGVRHVVFRVTPGPRAARVTLAFAGARQINPDELDEIVHEQKLEEQLFKDPVVVTELLERFYREQGYLIAEIDEPRYEFNGAEARVVLDVREGPRFQVGALTANGTSVLPAPQLIGELPLAAGDPFLPFAAENALNRIRDLYWARGYNDVRSDYALALDRHEGRVDVTFNVREGAQSVIAGIRVAGNDKTSERLVREQLEVGIGQPLNLASLSRSRRNLYDTGAFSVVDVTRQDGAVASEANAAGSGPDKDAQPTTATSERPVDLAINVREVQPFQLRYGASYDTERGVGGIFDLANHNSLGKARVVGIRSRYDTQLREGRLYMNQPSLRYFPIELTGSIYYREERNPTTEIADAFDVDRKGLSIQGETTLGRSYVWSYGYRYERARTFDPRPGGTFDQTVTVAPLTSTFTREGRDEVLDATRGSFTSHAFAYSPSWLGGEFPFVKYFGQYFHYIPLQPERRERFTNEIIRPRLVFATGVRLGLAHGFDGSIPTSERFFAGGSTTLRGFAQNSLGPIGADRLAGGGDALFVLNNEVRFPLVRMLDGVVFADIGNVFPNVSDFSLADLRKTAGLGLRVRTRWVLIRGDYGFVLDQRPGERRGRFYFSIGQAF